MRDIKFRAWNAQKKKMSQPFGIFDIHTEDYDTFAHQNNAPAFELGFIGEKIMQFTGLKDKNGKEIYEGDICRNDEDEIGIVVFHEGSFVLELINTFDPMCPCNYISLIEEVIGNKYKNPELLK